MNEKGEARWLLDRMFGKLECSLMKQLPPKPEGDTDEDNNPTARRVSREWEVHSR